MSVLIRISLGQIDFDLILLVKPGLDLHPTLARKAFFPP